MTEKLDVPAHAGVSHRGLPYYAPSPGRPRARGGEPLAVEHPLDVTGDVPAHAGVSPSPRSSASSTARRPRARGGEPPIGIVIIALVATSPRTRG